MTAGPYFVDANIFIRHLTQDHARFSPACTSLLAKAERQEITLTTSESVITEVVQILSSPRLYQVPREKVCALLTALLSLPGMRCAERTVYLRALAIYARENIDFPDCLTVAHIERSHLTEIYSYDTDFDRFATIRRHVPEGCDTI